MYLGVGRMVGLLDAERSKAPGCAGACAGAAVQFFFLGRAARAHCCVLNAVCEQNQDHENSLKDSESIKFYEN